MTNPHTYDIKSINSGVKQSFGMAMISTNGGGFGMKSGSVSEMSKRYVPKHL
jgi:hypothetical protein